MATRKSHKPKHTWKTITGSRPAVDSGSTSSATIPAAGPVNPLAAVLAPLAGQTDGTDTTEKPRDPKDSAGAATSPVDPNAKPYWFRPAGGKVHKLFQKIAVMREAGRESADIAKRLGTTEGTVNQTVWLAKKNGWCDPEGEPIDIEAELAIDIDRKIVRNISSSLDGNMTNWQTHEMTMAAAKGRGMFKNHDKVEGGGAAPTNLVAIQVQIIKDAPPIIEENVGGVPSFVEGEVEDGRTELGQARNDPQQALAPAMVGGH